MAKLAGIRQTLDLWSGVLSSHFEVNGVPVDVETCVHPQFDLLAVTIVSPLIESGALAIGFKFPYGSIKYQCVGLVELQPAPYDSGSTDRPRLFVPAGTRRRSLLDDP